MTDSLNSRNTVRGFSERVCRNFDALVAAREAGNEVHLVTALITSLLGVIVFPVQKARESRFAGFNDLGLQELEEDGWPTWNFLIGSSNNLGHLLERLRNAISHRRVVFSGEELELNLVTVTFSDRSPKGTADNWRASILASELLSFKLLVARRLHEIEA